MAEQQRTKLHFRCNSDWQKMPVVECGRYCSECKENVRDYSNLNISELQDVIKIDSQKYYCGKFKAYQLHRPFGDIRDKLIESFRRIQLKSKRRRIFPKLGIAAFMILIVVSGCRRRMVGRYAPSPGYKIQDQKSQIMVLPKE